MLAERKRSIFSRTSHGIKSVSDMFGHLIKIGFNVIIILFIFGIIMSMIRGKSGQERVNEPLFGSADETIAVIDLTGTILDVVPEGPFDTLTESQMITPRGLLKTFETIRKDPDVKAVILRINSPGGSVTASEEIYQMIKRFRQETGIPVIASHGEIAASGGYYISLGADTIISDPTTLTGSIGVIAQFINIKDLADQYGVRQISITSGNNKSFLSPLEETDEEQVTILKEIVDEAYEQFLTRVRESRNEYVSATTIGQLADGRPLTGKQAQEAGFVDQTGNFNDAVLFARNKINVPDARVVEYGKSGFLESLLGVAGKITRNANPVASLPPFSTLSHLSGTPAYLYVR